VEGFIVKKTATLLLALLLASSFAAAAFAAGPGPWWVKGSYYCAPGCWNGDAGNLMYDDGTNGDMTGGDGIFTAVVTSDQAAGRHEFKVANEDWSESYYPHCNLWVHTSGPGDVVTFWFDTNVYADGWYPTQDFVWSDHAYPPGTTFEVMGSAPETGEWTTGVAATLDGFYWTLCLYIATPGTYEAKFRATGDWEICNIGNEGAAAPCGGNLQYTTTYADEPVTLLFDTRTGRATVEQPGPTPAQLGSWGKLKSLYR
jgi:hypothetical protein